MFDLTSLCDRLFPGFYGPANDLVAHLFIKVQGIKKPHPNGCGHELMLQPNCLFGLLLEDLEELFQFRKDHDTGPSVDRSAFCGGVGLQGNVFATSCGDKAAGCD